MSSPTVRHYAIGLVRIGALSFAFAAAQHATFRKARMANGTHDIKTLNSLLATVIDSVDGFEQANKLVDTASFKPIFFEVISERRKLASEVEARIRTAGGTPDDEGTMLASAHRVLMRLRDAVSNGDVAVVDEAERGEDHIKAKFETAAKDTELSTGIAEFVAAAAARVKMGHDMIRDLKHSLHAAQ